MKKRYIAIEQMGVKTIMPLDAAIEELKQAYEHALLTDTLTVSFVEMTEAEYDGLKEFEGY